MNDLLKEAIADAKAVREVALANAKLALEEAFTPRLQSMLSQKLAEEAEMDDEDMPAMEAMEAHDDEEEPKMEGEAHDDEEEPKMEGEAHDDEEEPKMEGEAQYDDEEIDEDLMEIIRQLEEDIDSSEIGGGDNKKPSKEASDDTTDDPGKGQKLIQLVEKEGNEDDSEIEEMIRSIREEDDDETEKEKEVSETSHEEDDDSIDIKEILRALREEDEEEEKEKTESKESKDDEKEVYESRLKEAYAVISFLRSKINEVNLLNSKLLFSNKLFKKHSLTETQKLTVIENFDRASTLREVKLVYATLSEALKTSKIRTIKESFASKPTASTKPKTIINESNDMADRLRKLAGLK